MTTNHTCQTTLADPPEDGRGLSGGPTIYMETFGCQMNTLDSQLVRGQLMGLGYRFIDDWRKADVILYNTCSVRQRAEQKVQSRVGEVGLHKKEHRHVVLGVLGCMAQRDGIDLIRRHGQVDLLCGPGELDKVPMLIDNALKTDPAFRGGPRRAQIALQGNTNRRSQTLDAAGDQLEMLDLSRSFSPREQQTRSAYVRITRGCNKFCSYCVVPYTRGQEVHRPPQHILDECRQLVEQGAAEITLLGQTVNHYHFDHDAVARVNGMVQPQVGSVIGPNRGSGGPSPVFKKSVVSFADLLASIHDELPDLQRLRFVTSFPRDFGDDILKVMAKRPRICRYLHLPVQSGSDRILKLMNRGYSVEEYYDLIDRARRYLGDVEIASDIICGFPSETAEDHEATVALLQRCRFKNCFIFKYSPRPGTAAIDRLPDDVLDHEKKRRNNHLLAIQSQISRSVHERYVGCTVEVFVTSVSQKSDGGAGGQGGGRVELGWRKPKATTQLSGRTGGDLIVCFDGDAGLIGHMVRVKVSAASPLTLLGSLWGQPAGG